MLSANSSTFDTSSTPTSAQRFLNLPVLVFLDLWVLRFYSCSGNICFQWLFVFIASHFDICTGASIGSMPEKCSEFPFDLRAHCSATIVSQLLSIVHNVGFCGFQFFAQIEIEDVVLDVGRNELFLPYQFTCLSKYILISWPKFLCTGIMKPPSDPK